MSDTAMNYDYPDASFEEVRAILREVAEGQKETRLQMQETDRKMQETDRLFQKMIQENAESRKETYRLIKENAERQKQEADQRKQEADQRMQEADQRMQETNQRMQETDRLIKENAERQKETDRLIKETDQQMKETARQMKITDKKFGELSNRFGELAEHLVIPNIKEKFNALGFTFVQASENIRITDLEDNCLAEIDILLENGSIVMVLEIKSKPSYDDVADHIKRMEIMRRDADARNDKRMLQGAVAGAIMTSEVRKHIQKNGFYAIEQTGDTVKINTPEGFKARQW